MALEFLNKKGFHPSNLRNTEKIWKAEQEAEKEKRRLDEFKKQLAEEREILELEELQEKLGTRSKSSKMDWMYEGPGAGGGGGGDTTFDMNAEKTAEEYLLGKEFKPKDDPAENIKALESKPGSLWLAKQTSNQNEVFSRLQEDPLVLIRQNEKKARENVVYNPVKMGRIKAQLQAQLEEKKAKKAAKKMKKEAKKAKKKEKKLAKKMSKEKLEESNDHYSTDSKPSHHKSKKSHRLSPEQHKHGHRESYGSRDQKNGEDAYRRSRDTHSEREILKRKTKYGLEYGLQGGKGDREYSKSELGPSREMLAKAEERNAKPENDRPRKKQKLSEEERQRRIREMEQDANTYEEVRKERSVRTRQKDEREKLRDEERYRRGRSDPDFLRSMHKKVYSEGTSMEERMRRNKHYHQKGADSHKFLDR
mmetsp:Transcript_27178/g.33936  ORF Transcript_27178/g.33936 Transcript_27178/m.33936 type:complete len:421 (-) Transcript_27178:215-1477(-)